MSLENAPSGFNHGDGIPYERRTRTSDRAPAAGDAPSSTTARRTVRRNQKRITEYRVRYRNTSALNGRWVRQDLIPSALLRRYRKKWDCLAERGKEIHGCWRWRCGRCV